MPVCIHDVWELFRHALLTKMAIGKKRRHLEFEFSKLVRGCMKYEYVLSSSVWKDLKTWKILMEKRLACVCCHYNHLCACGFRTAFVTFRSSLRKGEPSWSVTLTWSCPLSLTSLRILISCFLCLCVYSVFMYVCFPRCYFHETTKGRRRWVLILKPNISCFCCFWIQSNLPTPTDVP